MGEDSNIYDMVNNQNVQIISQVSNGTCNSKLINSYLPPDLHYHRDRSQPSLDMRIFCPSVVNSCCGDHQLRYMMHLYLAKKLLLLKIKAANEDIFNLFSTINETHVAPLYDSAPACFLQKNSDQVRDKILKLKSLNLKKWSDSYFQKKLNMMKGFVCSICSARRSKFFDIVKLRNDEIQSMVQISENMCFDYLEEKNDIEKIKQLFGEIRLILGSMQCAFKFLRIKNKHVLRHFFNSSSGRVLVQKRGRESDNSLEGDMSRNEVQQRRNEVLYQSNNTSVGDFDRASGRTGLSDNSLRNKTGFRFGKNKYRVPYLIPDNSFMKKNNEDLSVIEANPLGAFKMLDKDEDVELLKNQNIEDKKKFESPDMNNKQSENSSDLMSSFRIKKGMKGAFVMDVENLDAENTSSMADEEMSMVVDRNRVSAAKRVDQTNLASTNSSEDLFVNNGTVQRIQKKLNKMNNNGSKDELNQKRFQSEEMYDVSEHQESASKSDQNEIVKKFRPRVGRFKSEKWESVEGNLSNRGVTPNGFGNNTKHKRRRSDSDQVLVSNKKLKIDERKRGTSSERIEDLNRMPRIFDQSDDFPILTDDEHEGMWESTIKSGSSEKLKDSVFNQEEAYFDTMDKEKLDEVLKRLRAKMDSQMGKTEQNVNIRTHNTNFMEKCMPMRDVKTRSLSYTQKLLKASCLTYCRRNIHLTRVRLSRTYFRELYEVYEILSEIVLSSDPHDIQMNGEGAFYMRRLFGGQDEKKFQRLKRDFKNSGLDLEEMGLRASQKKPFIGFYKYNHGGAYDFDKFYLIEITPDSGLDLYKDNKGNFGLFRSEGVSAWSWFIGLFVFVLLL